jgi:hypothetical protein
VKKNAIAGHSFASWEAFEAHLAKWEREVPRDVTRTVDGRRTRVPSGRSGPCR